MRCIRLITLATLVSAQALAQGVPPIDAALACGTVGTAGVTQAGARLFRVDIPTADYPDAICNDGSPGVFYVVASPGGADADNWHIHLQGGGTCRSADACARRWCKTGGNFGMDKMTSTLAPAVSAAGNGMLSNRIDNPLRDYNHVLLHYCSSDNWSGQASDIELSAANPGGPGTVDFSLNFRGAAILDAVLDMLRRPGGVPVSYFDGVGNVDLPDLNDAERVIFAGSSAGGGGITRNLDHVSAELASTNDNCTGGCDALVLGVIDATYAPDRTHLDITRHPLCLAGGQCTWPEFAADDWEVAMLGLWNTRTDQSCRDWHAVNAPELEWRCADHTWLIAHHLTTPFFLRFDLQDSTIGANMISALDPSSGSRIGFTWRGMWTDWKVFGVLAWEQMRRVRENWKTAVEGHPARGEPSIRAPGVFAPQCTKHETLKNNEGFFDIQAPDENGVMHSMAELLSNWIDGVEPQVAIESLRGTGPRGHCP